MGNNRYNMMIRPLSKEEGGGYLASYPDLPGCCADGDTPEEASREAQDALESYLETAKELGNEVKPTKNYFAGGWRQRVPKSLHANLAIRAQYEGVSLNTLVINVLSRYIGSVSEKMGNRDKELE